MASRAVAVFSGPVIGSVCNRSLRLRRARKNGGSIPSRNFLRFFLPPRGIISRVSTVSVYQTYRMGIGAQNSVVGELLSLRAAKQWQKRFFLIGTPTSCPCGDGSRVLGLSVNGSQQTSKDVIGGGEHRRYKKCFFVRFENLLCVLFLAAKGGFLVPELFFVLRSRYDLLIRLLSHVHSSSKGCF